MHRVLSIGAVTLALALTLLSSGCQPATVTTIETPTATGIPASDPKEPAASSGPEEVFMKLQPIPIFPAYYREDSGSIFGIPTDLQGMNQRVKIDPLQEDGSPAPVTDFYIKDGIMYVEIADPEGGELYFAQEVGGAMIDEEESPPAKPSAARVVVNLPGFTIETATFEGQQVSEIWNRDSAFVSPATPKGCGPMRYPMVSGYVQQDAGLLFCTGEDLRFIPQKRTAADPVSEAGRLWK